MKQLHPFLAAIVLLGMSAAAPSFAGEPDGGALTRRAEVLSRAGAQTALRAALDAATRLDAACAVAVVDPSGTLMAFESSDGVRAGSADLALGKARAAALLQRPTAEIEDRTNQGRVAFVTAGLMALRGGVPLRDGAVEVGAIGVAGLNKDNDVRIATEAGTVFAAALREGGAVSR